MDIKTQLHNKAVQALAHAHSPYSKKQVGAAILMDDGKMYSGCNIENASYGGTVCAERVAIWKAISESKSRHIVEVVVVTDAIDPWPPCGMCLQVIAEFADPEQTLVHTANPNLFKKTFRFKDLLPEAFNSKFLKP